MGKIDPLVRPLNFNSPNYGLPDPNLEKKQIWYSVIILTFVSLILLGIGFLQTDITKKISGLGGISGVVTDEVNQPIKAQVYVVGEDLHTTTSSTGRFKIEGIPAGENSLVIVYQDSSMEYPVIVDRGICRDVGQIYLSVPNSPLKIKKP